MFLCSTSLIFSTFLQPNISFALNYVMYMIMACILLYLYCMKYFIYMTVVILIVVGNNVFFALNY